MAHAQHANPNQSHNAAHDEHLRRQLTQAIRGGEAHLTADKVFSGVKFEEWGARPGTAPHSLWQLLEHTRFALQDLLVFSTDPDYKAPKWPDAYWPKAEAPQNEQEAERAVAALLAAQAALADLVENPSSDLCCKIPWGDGQTILREALLAATHTSYHLGQAMFLRKQLEP